MPSGFPASSTALSLLLAYDFGVSLLRFLLFLVFCRHINLAYGRRGMDSIAWMEKMRAKGSFAIILLSAFCK